MLFGLHSWCCLVTDSNFNQNDDTDLLTILILWFSHSIYLLPNNSRSYFNNDLHIIRIVIAIRTPENRPFVYESSLFVSIEPNSCLQWPVISSADASNFALKSILFHSSFSTKQRIPFVKQQGKKSFCCRQKFLHKETSCWLEH